jgi:DNA-binding LacI/PurR family transcriptional regulator
MKRKVSARDVAEKAGVSRTTVSFVLNNTPGKTISEETRQKVLQAAAELDYLPNDMARKLAMRKHRSIGLFICYNHYLFSDAYVIRLVEGMTPVLNKHRVQLVIQQMRLSQANYLELAREDEMEGVILFNIHDNDDGLRILIDAQVPTVLIGSVSEGSLLQVDIDNTYAAKMIVEYLVELGHMRIALILHAKPVYSAAQLRYIGYQQALEEAGLTYHEDLVRIADFSEESGFRSMEELLQIKPLPTAVFASNDTVAYGAIQAIRRAGLTIPGDISIAGFDDDHLSRYLNPPLTTMSVPASGLGGTAARLLIDMLDGEPPPGNRKVVLPTYMVIRSSCKELRSG